MVMVAYEVIQEALKINCFETTDTLSSSKIKRSVLVRFIEHWSGNGVMLASRSCAEAEDLHFVMRRYDADVANHKHPLPYHLDQCCL